MTSGTSTEFKQRCACFLFPPFMAVAGRRKALEGSTELFLNGKHPILPCGSRSSSWQRHQPEQSQKGLERLGLVTGIPSLPADLKLGKQQMRGTNGYYLHSQTSPTRTMPDYGAECGSHQTETETQSN